MPDYNVVVFENWFSSFSDRADPDEITEVTDLVPVIPGVGRCEVVCFTSDHRGGLAPPRSWSCGWGKSLSNARKGNHNSKIGGF